MKKMLLLVFCLASIMALLILTVNAAEYDFGSVADPIDGISQKHIFGDEDHGSGDHHDGWYLSKDGVTLNNDVAKVKLGYINNGVTSTVTYPAYYILENNSTLTWNFTAVSQHLGVTLNVGNVVAIEIPYGITVIPEKAFVLPGAFDSTVTDEHPKGHVAIANTTLEYVFASNTVLELGDFAFAHCTSLSNFDSNVSDEGMAGNHDHQIIQKIGYRAFHDCVKLTSFNFNNHLNSMGEGAFQGCSFTSIDLSKCIELKVIPAYCFHESNAGNVTSIVLSNSVEVIGDYAFTGASAEHMYLGTDVREIGHNAIVMSDADYFILPATIEVIYGDSINFGNNSYQPIIIAAESASDVEALFARFSEVGISLKQMNNPSKVYNDSVAFLSNTNPSFCESYLGGHTVDHDSKTVSSVSYPNGINHKGYAMGSCGVCGQMLNTQVEISPIIIAKGFSICTYNNLAAFSNGFEVYHDALALYETVYGECEVGIVFLLESKYNSSLDLRNDIGSMGLYLDEDSLLATGQTTYVAIDYIMTYSKGLTYETTDAQGNTVTVDRGSVPLVISAYVLHKDATKAKDMANKSYYVQDTDDICIAGKTTDDKYATVSYNSIYGFVKSQNLE